MVLSQRQFWDRTGSTLEKEQSAAHLSARPNMVPENWDKALRKLSGAYSDNTLRAYASDFRIFQDWCLQRDLSFVPAEPETLGRFIENQAKAHKPSTVCRRLDAINRVHRLCGFKVPTDDEDVRLTLRRMQRRHGRRQKQALGLTAHLRDQLIEAASRDPRGLRNRALIAVGYDTLCRSSEIAAMRLEHIRRGANDTASILIPRSKADYAGKGRIAHLSPATAERLDRWLEAAGITEGPIFQGLHLGRPSGQPLQTCSIRRLVKRVARSAGLPEPVADQLSGHSMRVGAAQDMMVTGFDMLAIMQAGGWTTPHVVSRYVENASTRSLHERRWAALEGLASFVSAKPKSGVSTAE